MLEELPMMAVREGWPTERVDLELKTIAAIDGGWSELRFVLEGLKIAAARQAQTYRPRYPYDPYHNSQATQSAPQIFGFNGQSAPAAPILPILGFSNNQNAQIPPVPPMLGFNTSQLGQVLPVTLSFKNDQVSEVAAARSSHGYQSQDHGRGHSYARRAKPPQG